MHAQRDIVLPIPSVRPSVRPSVAELVMGHFFKTQPNPKFLEPTQPIIDTWYGILGYTENFIQQLLHVTDKFTNKNK